MTANHSPGSPRAVSDADLIRYLDGELSGDEQLRIDGALATDTALASRMETLRRRSQRLRELLAATDPSAEETAAARARRAMHTSMPGRDSDRRVWLKAAILLLTLLGGAMIVPPVRAWVIRSLEQMFAGGESSPVAPAPEPIEPPADNFGAQFAVTAPTFTIEIAAWQAAGRLTVNVDDVQEGHAELRGPAAQEGLLVVPDRNTLRIQNRRESRADYIVTLPRQVTDVNVRFADGSITRASFTPNVTTFEVGLWR